MRLARIVTVSAALAAALAACGGGGGSSAAATGGGASSSSSSTSSSSSASAGETAPPLLISASLVPAYTCAHNLYVDASAATGGDGSQARPWQTPQTANDSGTLQAGDCVNLATGTYNLTATLSLTHGGNSNVASGYVVYRSATLHGAHLKAQSNFYQIINVETAYIVLDGLDIDGNGATNVGEAVGVSGDAGHHHVIVENNLIHDAGGGGVQMNDSEYFWIVGNIIYGNASTNTYQESGISTYQAQRAATFAATAADTALPWHIIIAGNISRDNGETYACGSTPGCHTDGNGVIIDKTLNVDRSGGVPYTGGVLVAGNLVYGNGGAGIQAYLSQYVTVANNTVYNNHLDTQNSGTWRGELSNANSDHTTWINNIAWAVPGTGVLANNSAVLAAATTGYDNNNVAWGHNLTFGGPVDVTAGSAVDPASNLINTDPKFNNLAGHDFTLQAGSPARSAGQAQTWLSAATPDIGAY